jgi:glycosyltransferase involved in cell wall biosynthesis
MTDPLVSCVIATHNDGKYLDESVQSVLSQTLGDIECIVIDDGSIDDTPTIARRWKGDQRFSYIRQSQSGVAKARNAGIRLSRGQFVAFLDADDRWDANKLQFQYDFLQRHSDLEFCWGDQELMNESGIPFSSRVEWAPEMPLTVQILLAGWNAPPSCWLIKRHLLTKTNGFDESIPSGHEDVELMFRMADCAMGARSPNALTWRRIRTNSISRNTTSKRIDAVRVYKKMLSYDNGRYGYARKQAMFAVHRFLAGHCWENHAYWASTVEAIQAAFWNPGFVFDRAFIDSVFLGHLARLFRHDSPEVAKVP